LAPNMEERALNRKVREGGAKAAKKTELSFTRNHGSRNENSSRSSRQFFATFAVKSFSFPNRYVVLLKDEIKRLVNNHVEPESEFAVKSL